MSALEELAQAVIDGRVRLNAIYSLTGRDNLIGYSITVVPRPSTGTEGGDAL